MSPAAALPGLATLPAAPAPADLVGRVRLDLDEAVVVAAPEDPRPGAWAGAPSTIWVDDAVYLAYRLRRPVREGRGVANVVARSVDGVHFETVTVVHRDRFDGDSLERPALVRTPQGRWRLYVSVATPGSKHWRVELLEADRIEDLPGTPARTVMPGNRGQAVKDPVLLFAGGRWHAWASRHPLDDPAAADRMTTEYATSPDGVDWTWHGTALAGRRRAWDARGARVSAVLANGDSTLFWYDGRASAAENWEERTGVAVPTDAWPTLTPVGLDPVLASPHHPCGLRYLSVLRLPDGTCRAYFEMTRPDGAHDLRTATVPGLSQP